MAAHRDVILNVKMQGTAAAQAAQLSTAFGGVQDTMKGITGGILAAGNAVEGFIGRLMSLKTLIAGFVVGKAISFFKDFITSAGENDEVTSSFQRLAAAQGIVADVLVNKLQAAVDGTVSKIDLMRIANKSLLMGVDPSKLEFLAKAAETLGDAVGMDAKQAFEALTEAIGRGSERGLYALGININLQDETEKYAKKLGKTTEELTEQEKRTIFLAVVMDELKKKMGELGDTGTSVSDKVAQLGVKWDDWVNGIKEFLIESGSIDEILSAVGEAMKVFFKFIDENKDTLVDAFKSVANVILSIAQGLPSILEGMKWIVDNAETILEVYGAYKGFKEGAAVAPALSKIPVVGPVLAAIAPFAGAAGGWWGGHKLAAQFKSETHITNNVSIAGEETAIERGINALKTSVYKVQDEEREKMRAVAEREKNSRTYRSTY